MAETKKPETGKREQFENAVYDLGLTLIEDFRAGRCRDHNKTLESIIELFKVSQGAGLFLVEGTRNGI